MIRLLVVILLAIGAWAGFDCPPAGEIYPCECQIHPRTTVSCEDVTSLSSVRAVLEGQFMQTTIPRLHLRNVHSISLPPRAFGGLSLKKVVITDSNIRYIEKDAFEGQHKLGLLMLGSDRLEDVPTRALQQLTSLRTLSLVGNFLMRLPEGSLNLKSLRFLALTDNRISQIDKYAFPKTLEVLAISQNLLKTFNGSLQFLDHLEELFASDNRLTNIKGEFEGLVNLKHLFLDRNDISDISDTFANLTSLTLLSLSDNRIEDVGKSLMGLTQLKHLNLSHNYITELHWRMFEKLSNLEVLDLSGNYLKSICLTLKPLRSLRELRLSDVGLKTLLPDCFHNMKNLILLDLSYNRLVNTDAVFRHPLPSLTYLRLDHNQLTALKHEMKYLKNLKALDIGFNYFSTLKAQSLSYNKELSLVKMTGNPWKCSEITVSMLRDLEQRNVELEGRPDC